MDEKKTKKVRYRKIATIAGGIASQIIPVADDEVVPEDELIVYEEPILEDEEKAEENNEVKEDVDEKVIENVDEVTEVKENIEKKAPVEKKTKKVRYRKVATIADGDAVQIIPVADDEVVPEDELIVYEEPILEDEEKAEENNEVKEDVDEKVIENVDEVTEVKENIEKKVPVEEDDGFEIEEGEPEVSPVPGAPTVGKEDVFVAEAESEEIDLVTPDEYKAELGAYLMADERFRTAIPNAERAKALQDFLSGKNVNMPQEVRPAFAKLSKMVEGVSHFTDINSANMDFIRGTDNTYRTQYAEAFNTVMAHLGKNMIHNPMMRQLGILATGSDNLNANYIRKHTDAVFAMNKNDIELRKEQGASLKESAKKVAEICVKLGTTAEKLDAFAAEKQKAIEEIDRQLQAIPDNQKLTRAENANAKKYDKAVTEYRQLKEQYKKSEKFIKEHDYTKILGNYKSQISMLKRLKTGAKELQQEVNDTSKQKSEYDKNKARLDKISEVSLDLNADSIKEKRQYRVEMDSLEKATRFFENMKPEVFDRLSSFGKENANFGNLSAEDRKLADEYMENKAELMSLSEKKDAVVKVGDFTKFFDAIESGNGDKIALTEELRKNINNQTRVYPDDKAYLEEESRQTEQENLRNVLSGYESSMEAFKKLPEKQKALQDKLNQISKIENALKENIEKTFQSATPEVKKLADTLRKNLTDDNARKNLGEACKAQAEVDKKALKEAFAAYVAKEKEVLALGRAETSSKIKEQIAQRKELLNRRDKEQEILNEVQEAQKTRDEAVKKTGDKFLMDKAVLDNSSCVIESKPDELILNQLKSVEKSLGAKKKNDSKSYSDMREALTNAIELMEGKKGEPSKDDMSKAMENLGKAAANYEKAKNSQWFHFKWFASEQRVTRLEGAANLKSICTNSQQMLKRMDSMEVEHRQELLKLNDLNKQSNLGKRTVKDARDAFERNAETEMQKLTPEQPALAKKKPNLSI